MPESPAFLPVRAQARANARNQRELRRLTDAHVAKWARRLRPLFHLPGLLSEVYVRGFEHLPRRDDLAPILAFSHKKIHDVGSLVLYLAGRPTDRFHDLTYIAQGGIFTPIYGYRDLMPSFAHRHFQRSAAFVARRIGRFTHYLFTGLHGYPVFRDGVDVPPDRDAYDAPWFAGSRVLGMPYEDFLRFAARETRNSVIRVQRDLVERNRTFIILPEGIYRHNGSVAPLQDFLGVTAFRKQRETIAVSLAYDELCPDRLRRIRAFLVNAPAVAPPQAKEELPAFTERIGTLLQEGTTIATGNLIALALRRLGHETFTWDDLKAEVQELARRAVHSPFVCDPDLTVPERVTHHLGRFRSTYGKRWIRAHTNRRLEVDHEALAAYADSERTCHDLLWNCNAVVHFARHVGYEPGGHTP